MRRHLAGLALLAMLRLGGVAQEPAPWTVRVTVVDVSGKPVAGANVTAVMIDERSFPMLDSNPMCMTNQDGICVVWTGNLKATRWRISASKYYSGYRGIFSFGQCPNQTAIVTGAESEKGLSVTIHIGPKAGIVRMKITDAATGRKLQGGIDFEWGGDCPEKFSTGLGVDGGDLLVAPNVPVGMVVESPGYETWVYPKGNKADAGTFVLKPSEVLNLDIRLKPKN